MIKNALTVYIGFSGCKVNQFEKNLLADKFLKFGFEVVTNFKKADIIVYNTCCVTEKAESGCRQALNKFHKENPTAKIVVTGCYAEKAKDFLSTMPFVSWVFGNSDKISIPEILSGKNTEVVNPVNFEFKQSFKERSRAVLKIQDGCDCYCSYCIVPLVRGKPVSMKKDLVLKNLWNLRNEREVVLTGIHLGKWGVEFGESIVNLMDEIRKQDFPFRIRLSSLYPTEITTDLLSVLKEMKNFCPHFHISLQSASDKILSLMGRSYKSYDFLKSVENIREFFPMAGIGIDVIVGFPGENQELFSETENLLKHANIDYMHIFPYSKRSGTKAAEMPNQISHTEKTERVKRLRAIDAEKRNNFTNRFLNKKLLCLVDKKEGELYRAVTREYLKVYIKENPGRSEFTARLVDTKSLLAILV